MNNQNTNGLGSRRTQEPKDKLYSSGNPIIKWLLNRLLRETAGLLDQIDAFSKTGLDIGCGEGNLIKYLSEKGVVGSLVAIDMDCEKLALAKRQSPYCPYMCSDIKRMNFKDKSFDYITASEVLEHILHPLEAIQEIQRVAKNEAYFIFSVPYEPFFRWGNILRGKYWKRGGRTPTHVNFWTRSELKKHIKEYVEIEKEIWFSVFPWMLFLGKFKQVPKKTKN